MVLGASGNFLYKKFECGKGSKVTDSALLRTTKFVEERITIDFSSDEYTNILYGKFYVSIVVMLPTSSFG